MFVREFACRSLILAVVVGLCLLSAQPGRLSAADEERLQSVSTSSDLSSPELEPTLQTKVVIPPGRPNWVEAVSIRGKAIEQTSVCSEPYASLSESRSALDQKIQQAVEDYIVEKTQSQLAAHLLVYDLNTIKSRLIPAANYYEETIVSPSVGEMHQLHARLEFPQSFQQEIANRWLQIRSAARLGQVGLGFVALLGFFSTIAGFFRADNATRGYYTGRLQFLAAGAILGLIVLGAVVARWIPWV